MSDNDEVLASILQKLDKNQESLTSFDKKLDLHMQEMRYELKSIKELDTEQNKILDEHSKRSDRLETDNKLREQALRSDMKQLDSRVETLELPKKWFALTKKWLLWAAAIAGAVLTIWETIKSVGH